MSQTGISYVKIEGRIRGPFRPAQLAELAEGGAISMETEAADSAEGPWRPIQAWPEGTTLFPPRPTLQFRAAEFEAVNRNSVPPVDHRDLIAWANLAPPVGAPRQAGPVAPKAEPKNEVLEIVREVARVDTKYAQPMEFPTRRHQHRHLIQYLILAGIGTLGVASIGLFFRPIDGMSVAILMGWAVLYNGGLAMIMVTVARQK